MQEKVTEGIVEPVAIDRGSILEGCKKSLFNAPLGLVVSCASIVAIPILEPLMSLVGTHVNLRGTEGAVMVSLISSAALSHVIAPLWTVPAACKAGKYREAIGSILATPFLAAVSFIAAFKFLHLVDRVL